MTNEAWRNLKAGDAVMVSFPKTALDKPYRGKQGTFLYYNNHGFARVALRRGWVLVHPESLEVRG